MKHRWGEHLKPVPNDADVKQKCVRCGMTRLTYYRKKDHPHSKHQRTWCDYKMGNRWVEGPDPLGRGTPPCQSKEG